MTNSVNNKYLRKIHSVDCTHSIDVDVYSVLRAFDCSHPIGHAVKKLLCAGARGYKDAWQDLIEAKRSIDRALCELEIRVEPNK